ncbi:hypothetical protein ACQJBY_022661 [Aegilops geniculata]
MMSADVINMNEWYLLACTTSPRLYWIRLCSGSFQMMQACQKSGALQAAHPEGLPWNPRVPCSATAKNDLMPDRLFKYLITDRNSQLILFSKKTGTISSTIDFFCRRSKVVTMTVLRPIVSIVVITFQSFFTSCEIKCASGGERFERQ